ncbi:MAG TPA: hypothetical protein VF283_12835 [Bryobacteraceae bacterium]
MKKQICSLAFCAIFGVGAAIAVPVAQDQATGTAGDQNGQTAVRHHRRANPDRQLHFLTKRLNLTGDQQKQILPLLKQQQQQMRQIFGDQSLTRKDRFAKMRSAREQTDNSIKAVLNDQQKQQWDQMQQQMRQRMQERRQQRENGSQGTDR